MDFIENSKDFFNVNSGFECDTNKYRNLIIEVFSNEQLTNYISSFMIERYHEFGIAKSEVNKVIKFISSNHSLPFPIFIKELQQLINSTSIKKIYDLYEKSKSSHGRLESFKDYIKGPYLGDIGCGTNKMAKIIVEKCPTVERVYCTDIHFALAEQHEKLEFKKQKWPTDIPIGRGLLSSALLCYAGHHIRDEHLLLLLQNINRSLEQGANFILLEDTYDDDISPTYDNKYTRKFLLFSETERKAITILCDLISTLGLKQTSMPLVDNYKSMKKWIALFTRNGFRIVHQQFLGIAPYSFHFEPKGIMIFKKVHDVVPELKLEQISIENIADLVRLSVYCMAFVSGKSQIGSSFSIAEILSVLFKKVLRIIPEHPTHKNRDRLILSKGHAASALYSILRMAGFNIDKLETFVDIDSSLEAHPKLGIPGIDVSSGSLGKGLSYGNGEAIAAKMDGRDSRIYVILGDGEVQKGQIFEAAQSTAVLGLDNLCAIVDLNQWQYSTRTSQTSQVNQKIFWESLGWETIEVDGHCIKSLLKAFDFFRDKSLHKNKPVTILAKTTKGHGVDFMKGTHTTIPDADQLLKGAEQILERLPNEFKFREILLESDNVLLSSRLILNAIDHAYPFYPDNPEEQIRNTKNANISTDAVNKIRIKINKKKFLQSIATREAIEFLAPLAHEVPEIIFICPDVELSVFLASVINVLGDYRIDNTLGRVIHGGLREADVLSTAYGLARGGKIPIVVMFDAFVMDALDPWRQIAIDSLPVILIATHTGIGVGPDDASHQSIEIAHMMANLPNIETWIPCDFNETIRIFNYTVEKIKHTGKGPIYIALTRQSVNNGNSNAVDSFSFTDGFYIIYEPKYIKHDKSKIDAIIIATGATVEQAINSAKNLENHDIYVRVINVTNPKYILKERRKFCSIIDNGIPLITVCDAIPQLLRSPILDAINNAIYNNTVTSLGVDTFGHSAKKWEELFRKHKIDTFAIENAILDIVKKV